MRRVRVMSQASAAAGGVQRAAAREGARSGRGQRGQGQPDAGGRTALQRLGLSDRALHLARGCTGGCPSRGRGAPQRTLALAALHSGAALEEHDGRQAVDAVLLHQRRVGIGLDLDHLDGAAVLLCKCAKLLCQLGFGCIGAGGLIGSTRLGHLRHHHGDELARAAPRGPEVNQHGHGGLRRRRGRSAAAPCRARVSGRWALLPARVPQRSGRQRSRACTRLPWQRGARGAQLRARSAVAAGGAARVG
jgi:hypothetical protein